VRLLFMGSRPNAQATTIISAPVAPTTSIVSNNRSPQGTTQIVTKPYEPEEYEDNDSDVIETSSEGVEISFDAADEDAQVAQQVLDELLVKMGIDGSKVTILKAEGTRADENTHWILNVIGRNINRLIGHRGETLSSLQYITRLIVSRRLQRRANIIVDAGGYKAKRSDRLRQLANRMADQAIRQARTVTLEPMPPHERRIIHLTLRKREDVSTKSIGEGKARKVTISPMK
jgi:spoIIIJ-associated protein